jgi:hypothetical protein
MTIKFVCTCGKHLKARDDMAARRSVCPRCGSPVGIPSLKPTHAGTTLAPLTPFERMQQARRAAAAPTTTAIRPEAPPSAPAALQAETHLVRLVSNRARRRPPLRKRNLELEWHQFLVYPLRAWQLCLTRALFLAILCVCIAFFLPFVFIHLPENALALWGTRACIIVLLVPIVGIPCSFLDCVLDSAAAGEVYYIVWQGSRLAVVLRSGAKWLACLLAGPIIFAAVGGYYWLKCGDPAPLDWLILVEIGVVGVAYWIFTLVSFTDRGRVRDLNPVAVADLAHRLGWRGLLAVVVASLLFLAHGYGLLDGMARVHTELGQGVLMVVVVWLSALYWGTLFCRLLGVWCHRSRLTAG